MLPPAVLPGLLLATALMLAGGPSLGPENPIIAVNVSLAVLLGTRAFPRTQEHGWVALAEAATIGALFGTPVAAALVISEALTGREVRDSSGTVSSRRWSPRGPVRSPSPWCRGRASTWTCRRSACPAGRTCCRRSPSPRWARCSVCAPSTPSRTSTGRSGGCGTPC
ncbi:chloride channel protein [Streptomyces sp. INA 01156]